MRRPQEDIDFLWTFLLLPHEIAVPDSEPWHLIAQSVFAHTHSNRLVLSARIGTHRCGCIEVACTVRWQLHIAVDCIVIVQWHIAGRRCRPRGGGGGSSRGVQRMPPGNAGLPRREGSPVAVQAPRL